MFPSEEANFFCVSMYRVKEWPMEKKLQKGEKFAVYVCYVKGVHASNE